MDIGYLANLAEILGGLAVISSLLYVGVQIRHNTKVAQTAATHNLTNTFLSVTQKISEDAEMARIWAQGTHDISALSSSDLERVMPLNIMCLRTFEDAFHHHQMGQMSDEIWEGWRCFILTICSYPSIRHVWESRKHFYSRSFQAFIDAPSEIERIIPTKKYIDLVSALDET
jgi:hypothetical protein